MCHQLNDISSEVKSLGLLANVHHLLGNFKEAITYNEMVSCNNLVISLTLVLINKDFYGKTYYELSFLLTMVFRHYTGIKTTTYYILVKQLL